MTLTAHWKPSETGSQRLEPKRPWALTRAAISKIKLRPRSRWPSAQTTMLVHFTSAYNTQSNGAMEVVCREVIRTCRALIAEINIGPSAWPQFVKMIQMVLKNSRTAKLGRKLAVVTSFTLPPPKSPFAAIFPDTTPGKVIKTISMVRRRS